MLLSQKFPFCFCVFVITICSQKSCSEAAGYKKGRLMRRNVMDLSKLQVFTHLPPLVNQPLEKVPALQDIPGFTHSPHLVSQPRENAINYGNLEISEPGFDFTDEEMQKLKLWSRGVIPYFIDDFSFDKVLRDRLRAFLEHTNTVAGVRFSELSQPPDDDSRWVFFINRRGVLPCADLDFRKFNSTGVQRMVIGYDCMEPGNLAEIVLALVGVPPQHNAPNRDKYVEVEKANIMPGKEHLFEKFSDSEWLFHEMDYDFTSAGHYGYHKYTANGGATLKPLEAADLRAGEVTSYSYYDIWKIRMLYNYIQKRNKEKDDTGACSKLFKPGDKLQDLTSDEDGKEVVKPRPKPSKYTGVSEEKLPQPDNYNDGDNNNKENDNNNEPENKSTGDSVKDSETNDNSDDKKPSSNEQKRKLKKSRDKIKKQPLAPDMENLSDIQTDK